MLNTDIRKNTDKLDNSKEDNTFNDTIDMNDFCKRRSHFSHSSCICEKSSDTDKIVNQNNSYSKNNNDMLTCGTYGLNVTYLIDNTTLDTFGQNIDLIGNVTIENSIQCK